MGENTLTLLLPIVYNKHGLSKGPDAQGNWTTNLPVAWFDWHADRSAQTLLPQLGVKVHRRLGFRIRRGWHVERRLLLGCLAKGVRDRCAGFACAHAEVAFPARLPDCIFQGCSMLAFNSISFNAPSLNRARLRVFVDECSFSSFW